MPAAARKDDTINGSYVSEHSGHRKYDTVTNTTTTTDPDTGEETTTTTTSTIDVGPLHDGGTLTGKIIGGSGNVFINGKPAATMGDTTEEHDECCGTSNGSIKIGSGTVLINGKPAARQGDAINAHNGNATINSGSGNVFIGG